MEMDWTIVASAMQYVADIVSSHMLYIYGNYR